MDTDIIAQLENALARLDVLGFEVPAAHVSMALDLLRIQTKREPTKDK